MGMMDYLIGKNVGRTEGKNSGASQADVDSAYAGAAETGALFWQIARQRDELQAENALLKKRFYREREKRYSWQRTAGMRKLSLNNRGVSDEQIYAEQGQFGNDPEFNAKNKAAAIREDELIDKEFIAPQSGSQPTNLTEDLRQA